MNKITNILKSRDFSASASISYWIGVIMGGAVILSAIFLVLAVLTGHLGPTYMPAINGDDDNLTLLGAITMIFVFLVLSIIYLGFFALPVGVILGLLGLHSSKREKAVIGLLLSLFLALALVFLILMAGSMFD